MPQSVNGYFDVILDDRLHRVVKLGQNLTKEAGCKVVLSNERDPSTNAQADFMTISSKTSTTKVKLSGSFTPPATGRAITVLSNRSHQFECSLWPETDRVIVLGANISADSNYTLTLVDKAPATSIQPADVLTLSGAGTSAAIPADGGGNKIPPNTGGFE